MNWNRASFLISSLDTIVSVSTVELSLLSFKSSPHPPPVILCGGFRVAVNIHIKYLQSWHKDNSYSFKYEVILVHNKNKTFRLYQVFRFGKSQLRRTEKLSLNQNQCVKSTTHYSGCRSTFSSKIWKESFDEWFYWSELWNTFLCNIAKFMYSSLVVLPQHRRLRSGIWLDHCNMRHVTTRCSSWVSWALLTVTVVVRLYNPSQPYEK